ncbi:unnamed protein product [Arabis nemorensis]|uniref:Uncharacterized protein n=1 Tax=Arabis nemorensis TaxID=586526 RepID=A0A565AZS2_9BRAS|nr:unnamed protein product [Arabis nemorensis]
MAGSQLEKRVKYKDPGTPGVLRIIQSFNCRLTSKGMSRIFEFERHACLPWFHHETKEIWCRMIDLEGIHATAERSDFWGLSLVAVDCSIVYLSL